MAGKHSHMPASLLLAMIIITASGSDRPRPNPDGDPAAFARWLVSEATYCILSTIDPVDGYPFGNVMSFTDAGTGVPYFYLTRTLDLTGKFAAKDERASCAITEKQLGTCGIQDPQSPGCSKFTIIGKLIIVQTNTTEGAFGESALFSSHPQFLGWPKQTRAFDVFKLVPVRLFLVNNFKPPRRLSVKKYLGYKFL